MKFPNSAEGDILKMVHVLFSPNALAHRSTEACKTEKDKL